MKVAHFFLVLISFLEFCSVNLTRAQSLKEFDKYAFGNLDEKDGVIVRTIKDFLREQNVIDFFKSENPFKRSVAVVIGINDYSKSQGFENLNSAQKDAIDMRVFLRQFGFDVVFQFLDRGKHQ